MALPTPAPVAEGVGLPQRPSKCGSVRKSVLEESKSSKSPKMEEMVAFFTLILSFQNFSRQLQDIMGRPPMKIGG